MLPKDLVKLLTIFPLSVDMPDFPVVVQPCPILGKHAFTHISFHALTVGVA
jgi:hypothetical protein